MLLLHMVCLYTVESSLVGVGGDASGADNYADR